MTARIGFTLLLALAALACSPEVPANPTYTNDVGPILMAHCVRCHGANNMLNTNPDVKGPLLQPRQCWLQRYGDEGDCTDRNNLAVCFSGAGYCGTMVNGGDSLIVQRITLPAGVTTAMPPLPADRLNDWEMQVLRRWSTANPAP
jgi:hypothetical protein